MDEIRYPIGAFELPKEITQKHITTYIEQLRRFPYLLKEAVKQCPPNILNLTYREGGLDNSSDSASLSRCGYE